MVLLSDCSGSESETETGERQDMDALQLRCHTEWLEDNSQVVDQMRWSSYVLLRRNWVTRNAFLAHRAV